MAFHVTSPAARAAIGGAGCKPSCYRQRASRACDDPAVTHLLLVTRKRVLMPSPSGVSRALCASPRCGVRARRTGVFAIVGKNRDRRRRRSLRRRDHGRRLKRADGRVVMPARHQPLQPSRLAPLGTLPNRAPAKRRSIFVGFSQGGQGVDIITRPQFSSVHRQILS